jgi:hypothetical protein
MLRKTDAPVHSEIDTFLAVLVPSGVPQGVPIQVPGKWAFQKLSGIAVSQPSPASFPDGRTATLSG